MGVDNASHKKRRGGTAPNRALNEHGLIYDINDSPRTIKEWVLYALQQVLAVFVATVLIANICGTPISACLIAACIGTLTYQVITGFKSPVFISSCGATCSAVIATLAISNSQNYLPVVIGGFIIALVYAIFAAFIKVKGIDSFNKLFPATVVGAVTMVIGLNLATFIPTYVMVGGEHSNIGVIIAIVTMLVVALTSHYFKGFLKTIPFLLGLLAGYIVCIVLTLTNVASLVDFSLFQNMSLFSVPDFTFKYWSFEGITWATIGTIVLSFLPCAIVICMEHYSDHKTLSNIIGTDLTVMPGLHRTLLGDGIASFIGTIVGGLPNTTYGESVATTGFSKVASTKVITLAAIIIGALAFVTPVQVFIQSIPSCVFGGCAMILYGFIAASGLKTLIRSGVDLNDSKNIVIVSVILTTGVSGIFLFSNSFAGVSLAMVLGVILNLILKDKVDK